MSTSPAWACGCSSTVVLTRRSPLPRRRRPERVPNGDATELIENPETFVLDAYGQTVWLVVRSGDLDHAEQLFAGCHRIVDSIASAEPFENERTVRAGLHAAALAAFGEVENDDPDQVNQYPYGSETIPFESSLGFEDWMERYDASVMRGIAADGPAGETTQYLTDVYRGGLSTHVRGYDPESADSNGGVTPRGGAHLVYRPHGSDRGESDHERLGRRSDYVPGGRIRRGCRELGGRRGIRSYPGVDRSAHPLASGPVESPSTGPTRRTGSTPSRRRTPRSWRQC